MWMPDIRTLFLVIFLIDAFLSLVLYIFWKTQKTYDGFFLWMASLLIQSCAYLLFILRGEISDFLTIPVANLLTMLGILLRIDGIQRFFRSRPMPVWYYTILIPIFLCYSYFTITTGSMMPRAVITTLFIVPCLFIAAFLIVTARDEDTRVIRYIFAISLLLPALVMVIRMAFWALIPADYTIFSTDLFNTAFFLSAILGDILATGTILMLHVIRSQKELRQINDKLNLLSSITRHDISNQLMALSGYLELSRRSLGNEERGAELIAKEERIAGTIAHQIRFAGDYEKMGLAQPEWQNVGAVIRKAAAALPVQNIRIEILSQDLEVLADPLLVKVFYNLIDNTLRYGGPGLRNISVSSSETKNGLCVIFADDGAGIPETGKQHLFERGYGKNTGLGLFLSRQILAITGITITETGEPGKGSRFEMLVPKGGYRFCNA